MATGCPTCNLSTDKWVKGLDVSLGLYNLFDTRYAHPGSDINWQNALEQDGRSARLKTGLSLLTDICAL